MIERAKITSEVETIERMRLNLEGCPPYYDIVLNVDPLPSDTADDGHEIPCCHWRMGGLDDEDNSCVSECRVFRTFEAFELRAIATICNQMAARLDEIEAEWKREHDATTRACDDEKAHPAPGTDATTADGRFVSGCGYGGERM